jgi:hypothetical protein
MIAIAAVTLVCALAALVRVRTQALSRDFQEEAARLWPARATPIDLAPLESLPPVVRRYLEQAVPAGTHPMNWVALRHRGSFRPSLEGRFFPVEGRQAFVSSPPGFVWWGRIRLAKGMWVDAVDRSIGGVGDMRVLVEGALPIGQSRGPDIDESAMVRVLGEMAWFPTAFRDRAWVEWSEEGPQRARATLHIGERRATAAFEFGPDGLPAHVRAERFRAEGKRSVRSAWVGHYGGYRRERGVLVPHTLEASWIVDGAEVPVLRFVVESFESGSGRAPLP